MKFQPGDLVKVLCCWFDGAKFQTETLPAIVIEAKSDSWVKVWIPARNETMVTFTDNLKHYDPK